MNYKNTFFLYFIFLILFFCSSCCSDCKVDQIEPEIVFSILDSLGNDLIDNNTYDSRLIRLTTEENKNIRLSKFKGGGHYDYYFYISNYNTSLESYNESEYYLDFGNSDIDTIRLDVTKMFNKCDFRYYISNSFSHNGVVLEQVQENSDIIQHYILIK